MSAIIIPIKRLSSEALQCVIEEFISRDGTDYGTNVVELETKISLRLVWLFSFLMKRLRPVIYFQRTIRLWGLWKTRMRSDQELKVRYYKCRLFQEEFYRGMITVSFSPTSPPLNEIVLLICLSDLF